MNYDRLLWALNCFSWGLIFILNYKSWVGIFPIILGIRLLAGHFKDNQYGEKK